MSARNWIINRKSIKKLKPKITSGSDRISCYIFKACKDILLYPLLISFQKSLNSGIFPKEFKIVMPIHKNGDRNL